MPRGFAWILALGVLAATWWFAGHPGWQTREQKYQQSQAAKLAAEPILYRWRDDHGVTQITQTPPKGRKYTIVKIRNDQNVFETTEPRPEPSQ
ncbi:MAG: DUF4124 domain-containing protein [Arenimonas sp.]